MLDLRRIFGLSAARRRLDRLQVRLVKLITEFEPTLFTASRSYIVAQRVSGLTRLAVVSMIYCFACRGSTATNYINQK